ncbi:hypothetical protein D9M72_448940 [compost metagenome]
MTLIFEESAAGASPPLHAVRVRAAAVTTAAARLSFLRVIVFSFSTSSGLVRGLVIAGQVVQFRWHHEAARLLIRFTHRSAQRPAPHAAGAPTIAAGRAASEASAASPVTDSSFAVKNRSHSQPVT